MKKKRAKKVENVKQQETKKVEQVTEKAEQQAFRHPLSAWDDLVFARRFPSPSSEVELEPTTEEETKEKAEEEAKKRGWSWI